MTAEQWQEVKAKLQAILELEPAQRPAYLDNLAPELRAELESLLVSHAEMPSDFLSMRPAPACGEETIRDSLIGRRLGPYKIVARIGHGGMGEVYAAFRADDQYRKQVAIKVVRDGRESGFVLSRFKTERQILASLEHPNIARLLDGGTTAGGLPYLVMELVRGESIMDYSNQRELDTRARLQLFLDVCSAVHFAHQRLIIHRDLKPSNIFVTEDGAPKLLDFGIAKILDPGDNPSQFEPTLTMFSVLTPGYASPEQIKGEPVTTATDVYSLGVVLYELLTGESPYRVANRTPQELARAVCDYEPKKPSSVVHKEAAGENRVADTNEGDEIRSAQKSAAEKIARQLRGDVDSIVLMALRKEPQRRYVSVEQFAQDIRRHLANLPVVARKDTASYLASKFVLRHKVGVAATLAVALALITALAVTIHETRIARAERAQAQRRFNDVRKLANSLVFDIHDSMRDLPGATNARQLLVQRASQYLDSLVKDSGNDVSLMRELAMAFERLGRVQGEWGQANQGDTVGALKSYRKAQALEEAISARGTTQDLLRYAQTYSAIGKIQWSASDAASALKNERKALAMIQELALKDPENQEVLSALASNYIHVADLMTTTFSDSSLSGSMNQTIEDYFRRALEIDQKLAASSADPKRRRALSADEHYLGRHLSDLGRWEDSVAALSSALAITQDIAKSAGNSAEVQRDLAIHHSSLGDSFLMGGRSLQALDHYQEVAKICATIVAGDPNDNDARLGYGENELNVGNALRRAGKYNEALEHLQNGTAILGEAASRDPGNQAVRGVLTTGEMWAALVLAAQKDFAAASGQFDKALATEKAVVRADPSDLDRQIILAGILAARGDLLQHRKQKSLAEDDYRQTISVSEALLSKAPDKVEIRYILAQAYLGLGQLRSLGAHKSSVSREQQFSSWNEAKSWLQRSSDSFHQIPYPVAVTPNGFDAITGRDIERAMSRCREALGRLRGPSS